MWIVRLALRRPYTFIVMSCLMILLGVGAMVTMPVDIFPHIDIPVVSVVWSYTGISPEEMEKRIITITERAMTTTVNDIEHIESQSYNGVSIIRLYFQPNVKIEMAVAQVTAICQTLLRILPPGTMPPNVLKYDASAVPVLQLGLSSPVLSEQAIADIGLNFIRTQLATVQGASVPVPYGGKYREVMVDLNPDLMTARGLSAADISNALNQQNLILPAGTAKFGEKEYQVKVNSSPRTVAEFNDLPVKTVNGAIVYLGDVAQVRDGFAVQSQHRAPGRHARRAADGDTQRPGLDAGHCRQGESGAAEDSRRPAAGAEGTPAVRPVDVRARRDQRRGAGSRDGRAADRPDDPACSWEAGAAR